MSGGHFDYLQQRMNYDIADEIERLIKSNNNETLNEFNEPKGLFYSDEVIEKFKETLHWVKRSSEMIQRIDWLISGDDGEESFLERWEKEVRKGNANEI